MISDDPPFLNKGDEVSAKYKGAFCEAIITNVQKRVECRVTLKHDQKTSIFYDSDIKGTLKVGSIVEVRKDQNKCVEGTIVKITDQSMYTVVFDDGDSNTLKRSKLCPKGDRHFTKSNSLDGLPLTHPEHFWSPVKKESRTKSSATNTGKSTMFCRSESDSDDEDEEVRQVAKFEEEPGDSRGCDSKAKQKSEEVKWDENRGTTGEGEEKRLSAWWMDVYQDTIGKVVLIELEDKTKKQMQVVPVLACLPGADENRATIPHGHVLVKSFKDNKFCVIRGSSIKEFNSSLVTRSCKWTRMGLEKAQLFLGKEELPGDWNKKELLGWSEDDGDSMSDDEQNEKKDRFVAELYRFMEERGTPINKVPSMVPGVDVDLCSLYKAVQSLGGYNKVSNLMKWNAVLVKLNLKTGVVAATKVKDTYKKYLHAFEEIDKRLGCNMIMPNKVRSTPGRNIISFRERDVDGKKDGKSKKSLNSGSPHCSTDESETKSPSSPSSCVQISDSRSTSTPVQVKAGKKNKDPQKSSPLSMDTPSRSLKNPRVDCEAQKSTESSSCSKTGKSLSKDSNPKSLRKLSREEVEKTSKEEHKAGLVQSRSNPSLTSGVPGRKAGDVKPLKASSDDMNGRNKPSNRTASSHLKCSKASAEVDAGKMERMRNASKVDWSEEAKKSEKLDKVVPTSGRRTLRRMTSTSEESKEVASVDGSHKRKGEDILGPGTRVVVRYGKGKVTKTYEAKVLEADLKQGTLKYLVHYNGWNSRYDEWLEREEIVNVLEFVQPSQTELEKFKQPLHQAKASRKKSSRLSDDSTSSLKLKKIVSDDNQQQHRNVCDEHPKSVIRKRSSRTTRSTASNESNEQNMSDEESNGKDESDDNDDDDEEEEEEEADDADKDSSLQEVRVKVEDDTYDKHFSPGVHKQDDDDNDDDDDDDDEHIEQAETTDKKDDYHDIAYKEDDNVIDDHHFETKIKTLEEEVVDNLEENVEFNDMECPDHIKREDDDGDDDDVLNNSSLGPPTLFSSQEIDDEFSDCLGNKRLSSSTECLPCLINEKDAVATHDVSEVSVCSHSTVEEVSTTEEALPFTKTPRKPGRKRRFSEAEEEDPVQQTTKRVSLDHPSELHVDVQSLDDVIQTEEAITIETICEIELTSENIGTSFEEKLDEVENVLVENGGSSEELNTEQQGSEWVDSIETFNDNEVDCTLLSQFASECTKESDNMMCNRLTMSADNSPPETSSDDCCLEPAEVTVGDEDDEEEDDDEEKEDDDVRRMTIRGDDEEGSTRSEREANQEVASYMKHSKSPIEPIMDSLSANEFSTASNDSCSGLGRKSDAGCQSRLKRKKSQDLTSTRKKLRKEGSSTGVTLRRRRSNNNNNMANLSESDGESSPVHHSAMRTTPTKMACPPKSHNTPSKSSIIKSGQYQRIANMKEKNLNFLDLEEGKYLIGEERIEFIMRKITQLKVAYMELKSELACLDRRRRRHRMKEASQTSLQLNPSSVA